MAVRKKSINDYIKQNARIYRLAGRLGAEMDNLQSGHMYTSSTLAGERSRRAERITREMISNIKKSKSYRRDDSKLLDLDSANYENPDIFDEQLSARMDKIESRMKNRKYSMSKGAVNTRNRRAQGLAAG